MQSQNQEIFNYILLFGILSSSLFSFAYKKAYCMFSFAAYSPAHNTAMWAVSYASKKKAWLHNSPLYRGISLTLPLLLDIKVLLICCCDTTVKQLSTYIQISNHFSLPWNWISWAKVHGQGYMCVCKMSVCECIKVLPVFAEVYDMVHLNEFLPCFIMSSLLICKKIHILFECSLKHYYWGRLTFYSFICHL